MDRRLIVTVAFIAHFIGGALFAIAASVTDATLTDGQLEFVVIVGYLIPTLAMGLLWMRNYVYGAPLLVGSTLSTGWFVVYFFLIQDNPANVAAVTGEGAVAYLAAVVAVVVGSLLTALVGLWAWYAESEEFRSRVDRVIRPPDYRE